MAVQAAQPGGSPAGASQSGKMMQRRETIAGYLFLSPYLITTAIFFVGLLLYAFFISFTNLRATFQSDYEFVGLQNYVEALTDREFHKALINAFWYFIIVTSLQTAGAIALAVILNAPIKARRLYRTLFYAPSVTSSVVISMIFLWLYLRTGFINYAFSLIGLPSGTNWMAAPNGIFQNVVSLFGIDASDWPYFLKGPSVTWTAIMAMNIFTTIPTFMVMFLAALQNIPDQLYEAAGIDGASAWQQFWRITLPLLRPTIVLVIVLSTIGTLQVFDQAFVMTKGGPLDTSLTPVLLIYTKTLGEDTPANASLAAAMAFILAAIIFIITLIQRRYLERGTEQYF